MNYFNEDKVSRLLVEYQKLRDDKIFDMIQPEINSVIIGMLNKHFIHNKIICANRDDAINSVYIEILKSIDSFNPEKGRAYAFINMIAKRSLINFYIKYSRINNREMTYTEFAKNIDEDNGDLNITNLIDSNIDYDVDNDNGLFENARGIPEYERRHVLSVDESFIIIYNYLKNIQDCFSFFKHNDIALNKLIEDIEYDVNACFCFTNISPQKDKKFLAYYSIISSIDMMLQKVLIYIKNRFDIDETRQLDNYDGKCSSRAISYIRTSVDKYIKQDCNDITQYFDTDNLIGFINYVIQFKEQKFSTNE